jgi:hypothetical protein
MTKADLEQLLSLSEKASAGPWEVEPHERWDKDININGRLITCDNDHSEHEEVEANAAFICLARKILPDLVSIVLDKWGDDWDG